ncbi:hypothetical protein Tco_0173759 [Tanacetum coccineum]
MLLMPDRYWPNDDMSRILAVVAELANDGVETLGFLARPISDALKVRFHAKKYILIDQIIPLGDVYYYTVYTASIFGHTEAKARKLLLDPAIHEECTRLKHEQVHTSLKLWKIAFMDAYEIIFPIRAAGHDCGCLSVLSMLIIEYGMRGCPKLERLEIRDCPFEKAMLNVEVIKAEENSRASFSQARENDAEALTFCQSHNALSKSRH